MRSKTLSVSMIIQLVMTAAVVVMLILFINCDKDAARYYLWNGGEIVYKNVMNEAGNILSALFFFLAVPMLIITILAAIKEREGSKRVLPILAAVLMTLIILPISALNVFVYSYSDPLYPDARFYEFDTDGVTVVLSERAWGLGAEINAFRITDDGHAQKLGAVSEASPGTYLPGGKYDLTREDDKITISYYENSDGGDIDENTPRIEKQLDIV